mgnify:CR=1 FL=1
MKVFSLYNRILLFIVYYLIHKNIFFGTFYKVLFKNFYYKNLVFNLNSFRLPISNYSSFLFKTYEYNDRILIEKYIDKKNRCIVIGGGLGFIASLCFIKSKKNEGEPVKLEVYGYVYHLQVRSTRGNQVYEFDKCIFIFK